MRSPLSALTARLLPPRKSRSRPQATAAESLEVRLLPAATVIPKTEGQTSETAPEQAARRVTASVTQVSQLAETDGSPDNKSQIVVSFGAPIQIADASRITITARMTSPIRAIIRIPVLAATVNPDRPNELVIKTGQLVPVGAKILFAAGSVTTADGVAIRPTRTTTQQGVSTAEFNLSNRAFKPTDINLFPYGTFPDASKSPTPEAKPYSEADGLAELTQLYGRQIAAGQMTKGQRRERLMQFQSEIAQTIIPEAQLRAALFALAGTVADFAIEAVLSGNNSSGMPYFSIFFDEDLLEGTALAGRIDDGRRQIRFAASYRAESLESIAAVMSHEVMHQDGAGSLSGLVSQNEEVIANAVWTLVWSEFLLQKPELASINTLSTRSNNMLLLAMLNSGNLAYPGIGMTRAPQIQDGITVRESVVFVGGVINFLSFDHVGRTAAAIAGYPDTDTPGNAYLTSFVARATGTDGANNGFTRQTRDFLEQHQTAISASEALQLARILKLEPTSNIVRRLD